jgi:hypothetical protein
MRSSYQRTLKHALLASGLMAAFWAGTASAEADLLDTAHANVTSALQALKDAPVQGDASKFEDHRKKAIMLLTRAQGEILKAKRLEAKK